MPYYIPAVIVEGELVETGRTYTDPERLLRDFENSKTVINGKEMYSFKKLCIAGGRDPREYSYSKRAYLNKSLKAMVKAARVTVDDHVVINYDMVPIGSGATREAEDYWLTRYACYMVIQEILLKLVKKPIIPCRPRHPWSS